MPNTGLGLQHIHRRKRIHQHLEVYPHPDKWKNLVDRMAYVVGFAAPLSTFPNIMRIWTEKDASGVSLITWSLFLLFGLFWLIYGTMHKAKQIILAYTLWAIANSFMVMGIMLYG